MKNLFFLRPFNVVEKLRIGDLVHIDFNSVLDSMKLSNGVVRPLPIVLGVDE